MVEPLEVRTLTDFAQLSDLRSAWDALWEADRRTGIFGKFAWAEASWDAYGSRRQVFAPAVFIGGRLAGLLPLVVENGVLAFLASPRSDYNDVLCQPNASGPILQAMFQELAASRVAWRRGVLENVPAQSRLMEHYGQLRLALGGHALVGIGASCASILFEDNREQVLRELLAKKSLTQYEKRLARHGTVTFRHLDGRDEMLDHLPQLFRQHMARWAMNGERSQFCRDDDRRFYYALLRHLKAASELRFSVLELDGRPVAYHLGFEAGGTLLFYKPTFDIDYWDCSPGKVLLRRLFAYVGERGLSKFDFTVGGEEYKDRFANTYSDNVTLYLAPPGGRGRAAHCSARTLEWVRKRPRLHRALSQTAGRSGQLGRRAAALVGRYGILGSAARAARSLWRSGVGRREELLVLEGPMTKDPPDESIELRDGTLTDLACLSIEYPTHLTPAKLAAARRRLQQGDRLRLAADGGQVVHIAWTGLRSEIVDGKPPHECRVVLEQPATVIYDCWTPESYRGRGYYRRVLETLRAELGSQGKDSWICCAPSNHASLSVILKAGFQPRYRLVRTIVGGLTAARTIRLDEAAAS